MQSGSCECDTSLSQPVPARVSELIQAACDFVFRTTKLVLDHSEESLAFVDHYVRDVRALAAVQPEVKRLVAAALGVYLGELLLSRFGGRWLCVEAESQRAAADGDANGKTTGPGPTPVDDPENWRVALAAAPLLCDPVRWAAQALDFGQDAMPDGGGLAVGGTFQELLAEAMARLPPVSEDYFFSLTGRFETVAYVVELLAEAQNRLGPPAQTTLKN